MGFILKRPGCDFPYHNIQGISENSMKKFMHMHRTSHHSMSGQCVPDFICQSYEDKKDNIWCQTLNYKKSIY